MLGSTVVSAGIDGTIRQWSLQPDQLREAVELAKNGPEEPKEEPAGESMLTEEEERELAELMADD